MGYATLPDKPLVHDGAGAAQAPVVVVVAVETVVTAKVFTVEVVRTVLVEVAAMVVVMTAFVEMTVDPTVLIVAVTEVVITEVTGAAVHAGCDWMHEQAVLMMLLACEAREENKVAFGSPEVVGLPEVLLVDELVVVVFAVDEGVDEVVLAEDDGAVGVLKEEAVLVVRPNTSPQYLLSLAAGCES